MERVEQISQTSCQHELDAASELRALLHRRSSDMAPEAARLAGELAQLLSAPQPPSKPARGPGRPTGPSPRTVERDKRLRQIAAVYFAELRSPYAQGKAICDVVKKARRANDAPRPGTALSEVWALIQTGHSIPTATVIGKIISDGINKD